MIINKLGKIERGALLVAVAFAATAFQVQAHLVSVVPTKEFNEVYKKLQNDVQDAILGNKFGAVDFTQITNIKSGSKIISSKMGYKLISRFTEELAYEPHISIKDIDDDNLMNNTIEKLKSSNELRVAIPDLFYIEDVTVFRGRKPGKEEYLFVVAKVTGKIENFAHFATAIDNLFSDNPSYARLSPFQSHITLWKIIPPKEHPVISVEDQNFLEEYLKKVVKVDRETRYEIDHMQVSTFVKIGEKPIQKKILDPKTKKMKFVDIGKRDILAEKNVQIFDDQEANQIKKKHATLKQDFNGIEESVKKTTDLKVLQKNMESAKKLVKEIERNKFVDLLRSAAVLLNNLELKIQDLQLKKKEKEKTVKTRVKGKEKEKTIKTTVLTKDDLASQIIDQEKLLDRVKSEKELNELINNLFVLSLQAEEFGPLKDQADGLMKEAESLREVFRLSEKVPIKEKEKNEHKIVPSKQGLIYVQDYDFLSNDYVAPFVYEGKIYKTVNEAYKTHQRGPNDYWLLERLINLKFLENPKLQDKLRDLPDLPLLKIVNNTHHEYWGLGKHGEGWNMLGKILEDMRAYAAINLFRTKDVMRPLGKYEQWTGD